MSDSKVRAAMVRVFSASIVAAVIIEYLLYVVYTSGVYAAFSPPTSLLFIPLVALAYHVYRNLLVFADHARRATATLLPPGIAGASVAFLLTLGQPTRFLAPYTIALVYLAELAVGIKLYRDLEPLTRLGSMLFVGGMALFIGTLPLAIFEPRAAALPMFFNVVKTIGLALLLYKAIRPAA